MNIKETDNIGLIERHGDDLSFLIENSEILAPEDFRYFKAVVDLRKFPPRSARKDRYVSRLHTRSI